MGITKWDLFKQIDQMPTEKYNKIKEFLDHLNEQYEAEVILDEGTKKNFEKSLDEYKNGDYLTFDQVFEDGGDREI